MIPCFGRPAVDTVPNTRSSGGGGTRDADVDFVFDGEICDGKDVDEGREIEEDEEGDGDGEG